MTGNNIHTNQKKNSSGYAILFSVLLVSIILAITLGVLNIALKEFQFTSTARNSHVSFFAADTGGECALYGRKNGMMDTLPPTMVCDTQTRTSTQTDLSFDITRFDFQPISVQDGCALVDIVIDNSDTQISKTTINSHGYNVTCAALQANPMNKVERLLSFVYTEVGGGSIGGGNGGNGNGGNGNGGNGNGGNNGGLSGVPIGTVTPINPGTLTAGALGGLLNNNGGTSAN